MTDEIKTYQTKEFNLFIDESGQNRKLKGSWIEVIKLTDLIALLEKRKTDVLEHRKTCIYWNANKPCRDCASGGVKIIESLLNQLRGKNEVE